MAVLGDLKPLSDGTISASIDNETDRTTPYFGHLDEDPASPGTDHITNDQSEQDGNYFIGFTDMPANFGAMLDTLDIKHSVDAVDDGSSNDALDVYASIVAADESTAYTDEVIICDELDTVKATTTDGWTVNATGLAASKADWNGAFIKLRWDYQRTGAGDNNQGRIYAVWLVNGTYTAAVTLTQASFRIRTDDSIALNTDSGWAAAENVNATIEAETIFRIRHEVGSDGAKTFTPKAQYNLNSGGWVDFIAEDANNPITGVRDISMPLSGQYADGAATTNLLTTEAGTFVAGTGEENTAFGAITLAAGEHTEIEFTVLLRKLFGDDASVAWGESTDGDTIQFRLLESDGTVFGSYTNTPTVTLNHTAKLISGTFVETPGNVGPVIDDNGNLYAVVEHAQLPSPIIPSMQKSTDGGDTWVSQDGADWAGSSYEMEAADLHHVSADDIIYMGWTDSSDPMYRSFQTSVHGTPDAWTAAEVEVTAVTSVVDQVAAIVKRSDGTVVMFYGEDATNEKLRYKIRTAGGTWGSQLDLETETAIDWTGVQVVLGASDLIHIIYSNKNATGEIYYKTLNSSDTLSARESVLTGTDTTPDHSPLIKPVYYDDGGTEKIVLGYYKPSDGKIYVRVVSGGTLGSETGPISDNTVISDRAASGQPTAALAVDGTTVYLVYSNVADLDIYMTSSAAEAAWAADTEIFDAVTCGLLSANIYTHNAGNGSNKVLGIVYDDERFGEGNTGGTVYAEHIIEVAGIGQPTMHRTQGIPTGTGSKDRPSKWN